VERKGGKTMENGDVPKETRGFLGEKMEKSRFHQEEVDFSRKRWEEKWDKHFEAAYGWSTSNQDSGVTLTAQH